MSKIGKAGAKRRDKDEQEEHQHKDENDCYQERFISYAADPRLFEQGHDDQRSQPPPEISPPKN
jgi:hypothetical protein